MTNVLSYINILNYFFIKRIYYENYYEDEALKNTDLIFGEAFRLKENLKKCNLSFAKSIANKIFAFGVCVVDIELTKMGLELGADINTPVDKKPALFRLCSNPRYTSEVKEVVEFLLGQDINTKEEYYPLTWKTFN